MKKICFWLCCFSMFSLMPGYARNIPDISGIFDSLDIKINSIGSEIKKTNSSAEANETIKQNNSNNLSQTITITDSVDNGNFDNSNLLNIHEKSVKFQDDFFQKDVWHSLKETCEYSLVSSYQGRKELSIVKYVGNDSVSYDKLTFLYLGVGRVNAPSGINLRKYPSTTAPKTGGLICNEVAIIINTNGPKGNFDNINDYWYYVKSKNAEGWCFGGFIDTIGGAGYFFEFPENHYEKYNGMIIACLCNLKNDLEKEAVKVFMDYHSEGNGNINALEACYNIDYKHECEHIDILPEFHMAIEYEQNLDFDPISCSQDVRLYWAIVKAETLDSNSVRISLADNEDFKYTNNEFSFVEFVLRKINNKWYIDGDDKSSFKTRVNAVVAVSNSSIYEKPEYSSNILKRPDIGTLLVENMTDNIRNGWFKCNFDMNYDNEFPEGYIPEQDIIKFDYIRPIIKKGVKSLLAKVVLGKPKSESSSMLDYGELGIIYLNNDFVSDWKGFELFPHVFEH